MSSTRQSLSQEPVPRRGSSSGEIIDVSTNEATESAFLAGDSLVQPIEKTQEPLNNIGIGWKTPTLILGAFTFAVLTAVCHYVFFHYLDTRPVERSLQQKYTTTVSTALITIFNTSLRFSLAVAFSQLLWYMLRKKFVKIGKIEDLYAILDNPLKLISSESLVALPWGFMLALLYWLIPAATIFVPGATTVVPLTVTSTADALVPYFNSSGIGSGSVRELPSTNLFKTSINYVQSEAGTSMFIPNKFVYLISLFGFLGLTTFCFSGPSQSIERLAKEVILRRDVIPFDSPCGANCSYTTEMVGPVFVCKTSTTSSSSLLTAWRDSQNCYLVSDKNPRPCSMPVYLGGDDANARVRDDIYQLDLQFMYPAWMGGVATVISCVAHQGSYKVAATFRNNIRTLVVETKAKNPITIATLNNMTISYPTSVAMTPDYDRSPIWTPQALSTYNQMNLISIVKALGSVLSGNITVYIVTPSANGGTMILDTALNIAENTASTIAELKYNLDATIVEDMLCNLTVSLMSTGKWTTTVTVNQSITELSYSFARKTQFFIPYFSTLFLGLIFVIAGLVALVRSGVSSNNGFIQIVTATAGSNAIRQKSQAGSLGGEENVSEELKELEVRFGEFVDSVAGGRRVGHGTKDEVVPLLRKK